MTNVVLFMSDEHNPRYASVYGHPFVQTPNLERLAARGTVYDNAYCPSPLCVPSRSAFMTGRHVHEIQRYNNCKVIEGRFPSYGGVLAEQGVHTAYIGSASNLYRDPSALGFSQMQLAHRTDLLLSRGAVRDGVPAPGACKTEAAHGPDADRFRADVEYVDRAVEWLHRTAPALGQPWTVTVNVHPPHPPYTSDPQRWEQYRDHADLPSWGTEQASAQHVYARDLRTRGGWAYSDELVGDLRRAYYGMISYVDAELGRVLDAVDAAGLADDTVVCYLTDHGEMLGTFGIWGKMCMYEDSLRVPVVAAGPGFTPGTRVTTPVSLLDVQAAMFHATGANRPGDWHGEPLQVIPADDPDRVVFSEYHGTGARGGSFMIRRGPWKLLHHTDAPHQLFHLDEDPDELVDRWPDEPDVVARLERELRAICDPDAVDRDARAFSQRQLEAIDELRAQVGPNATCVPWSEASQMPHGESGEGTRR